MLLALALLVGVLNPPFLQEMRLKVFDLTQKALPRRSFPMVDGRLGVRIVEIDQQSIDKFGQWPWPRTLIAELVNRIAAAHPLVLGIDMLFASPDRLSPPTLATELRRTRPDLPPPVAEALAHMPSNEHLLAGAIGKVPTVLGIALNNQDHATGGTPIRTSAVLYSGPDPRRFLPHYRAVTRSLSELTRAAKANGAINVEPDPDGVFRCLPLFAVWRGQIVPGFATALLGTALRTHPLIKSDVSGIRGASIGRFFVPTDRRGRACIHFAPARADRYISAATLLDGTSDRAPELKDTITLLGVTGLGSVDLVATPLGLDYGIEIHAQLLDSMLLGALFRHSPAAFWIELGGLLLGGLTMIWLVSYERPVLAAGAVFGATVILVGGEFVLFRFAGWLVDGVYPAIGVLVTFGAMLNGNLRAAQVARHQLAVDLEQERQLRARIDGELAAARAIQMGLLPHTYPAFPSRRDVDLYARIEPARDVGGDLFDYLMIDDTRLFFMIGDVSGKGIPAALFMAMSKEIVRDAAARHGQALDQLLGEANTKIAAASNSMAEEAGKLMFVTAFAAILDLSSGELVCASAGHDAPFILQHGREPHRIALQHNPPLGAIEDFPYPLERALLEPGAMLVLYTDGVTEAQDRTGSFYSADRLAGVLGAVPGHDTRSVVDAVFGDVHSFVGGAEPADDVTMLAVRRGVALPH